MINGRCQRSRRLMRVSTGGLLLLLLAGCIGQVPGTHYYLLSEPFPETKRAQVTGCGPTLGRVAVAPYLQRSSLVVQSASNEIVPASYHRWSEPIEAGITRVLSNCLVATPGAERVDIAIEHLHGTLSGEVVLQARWLTTTGTAAGRVDAQIDQDAPGYDALVTSQRRLLQQLCADIRQATQANCD